MPESTFIANLGAPTRQYASTPLALPSLAMKFARIRYFASASQALALTTLLLATMPAHALTGGAFSKAARYAPIVKIRTAFFDGNRNHCTGTFITPSHIMTAKHCVEKSPEGDYLKTKLAYSMYPTDELFFRPQEVAIPEVRFYLHPHLDLAIIEIDQMKSKSTLKISYAKVTSGETVTMTGYGCDKMTKDWSTPFKTSPAEIAGLSDFIKTKSETAALCQGDSGSPLLIESPTGVRIVGIASYVNVFKGALGLSRDRYVRLDEPGTRSWIESITKH